MSPGRPPAAVDAEAVAFRPVRSGNAFEECLERLLSAIRLGLVMPGQRLPPERELAGRLGVSRVTLREALRSLSAAGWLEIRRGRQGGAFVLEPPAPPGGGRRRRRRHPTPAQVDDVLVLRQALELGAVEVAAGMASPAGAREALLAAARECAETDLAHYRVADSRLHLAIAELTGSPSLLAAVADVRVRVNDLLDAIPLLERNIGHSNRQHDRIVRAVLRRHPAAARSAMAEHLDGTAALLRGFLS